MADDTNTFLTMLIASGETDEIKWFSYRPTYFGEIIRIEWDRDSMVVDVPSEYAGYLLTHGYARTMTSEEIEAYTAPAEKAAEPEKPPAPQPKSTTKGKTT